MCWSKDVNIWVIWLRYTGRLLGRSDRGDALLKPLQDGPGRFGRCQRTADQVRGLLLFTICELDNSRGKFLWLPYHCSCCDSESLKSTAFLLEVLNYGDFIQETYRYLIALFFRAESLGQFWYVSNLKHNVFPFLSDICYFFMCNLGMTHNFGQSESDRFILR